MAVAGQPSDDWLKEGAAVKFKHGVVTMYVGSVIGATREGTRIVRCYWEINEVVHALDIPEHLLEPA